MRTGRSWWRRIVVRWVWVFRANRWILIRVLAIVVVVLFAFWLRIVRVVRAIVAIGRSWCRSGVVLATLSALFAFAALHLGLFQQPTLFGSLLALCAVLFFIPTDHGVRRNAENIFVFAELADP